MAFINSLTNPTVFAGAPALPTGFYWSLQSTPNTYTYGEKLPLYQIGVVRQSDGATIWGQQFYPYNGYPDAVSMINTECQNTLNVFNEYSTQDTITSAARSLIGF